jgi:hypothetical protein
MQRPTRSGDKKANAQRRPEGQRAAAAERGQGEDGAIAVYLAARARNE